MKPELLAKYDQRIPRYTSYPTAPHFHEGVGSGTYASWLGELDASQPLSLYIHIPFCDTLCWFCGCHTTVVSRPEPVDHYLEQLHREIDLVAASTAGPREVVHVHLGGGSPTMLKPGQIEALFARLRARFAFRDDVEIAVEVDPRGFTAESAAALAAAGLTRVSIGVQDLDPKVQHAVNRIQPYETTRETVELLRGHGVRGLNIDLMYGLPHQTVDGTVDTVSRILALAPDRVALFGYAHVPWMKKHQRLIPEDALPGTDARWRQFDAATATLVEAGYDQIGLDHFARPGDAMAEAHAAGTLRRNFQGYTVDPAGALLGMGVSAIGGLPQGIVQNVKHVRDYKAALDAGRLPSEKGVALDAEDRLRSAVIERLMCDLTVDAGAIAVRHGFAPDVFDGALDSLGEMVTDGVLTIDGTRVTVPDHARPLVRSVAAAFDTYLQHGAGRHAKAV
jgi:oxygen-independent coproporphyrinogen-3 oxidase